MGYTFFDAPMVGSTLQPTMLLHVLLLLLPKILGFMFRVNKHIFYHPLCNLCANGSILCSSWMGSTF
jgi:hypothetical protein